ncbi:MAG: hypothetical protein KGL39_30915 [Patescibacteria group bacterium]|nr:hypothetical protein [Patescibacteria group bacterium]
MSRFTTTFANLPDGLQNMSLFDQAFAESVAIPEPTLVTTASAIIAGGTFSVGVERSAPVTTALILPSVADQDGIPLIIFDWSSSVAGHTITLTPDGSETIMRLSSWQLYSTADSLAFIRLIPSTLLSGWYMG